MLATVRENSGKLSLAILDWTMPGGEGANMLAELLEASPSLPVIICSGHSNDYFKDNRRFRLMVQRNPKDTSLHSSCVHPVRCMISAKEPQGAGQSSGKMPLWKE